MPRTEHGADPFEAQRPRLRRLAYRMLGSMVEADDIMQEAWLRWQRAATAEVRDPPAYLRRTVTRLCLDAMKSARVKRETYFGTWLPEPVVDPFEDEVRAEDLTMTLMLALERLSPLERAAFLLHDVFDLPLDEIATTLERDAAAVRQLAVRARKHVRDARPRYQLERGEGERMAQAFFTASSSGDLTALRAMLSQDVILHSDGGGKVLAFRNRIYGLTKVLRLYAGLYRKLTKQPASFIQLAWIDGLPGYISRERDNVLQTTALEIENGSIVGVYITRNPDKLHGVIAAIQGEGRG
jgi:RNA polymerase sigma factor (sigma-70 family)